MWQSGILIVCALCVLVNGQVDYDYADYGQLSPTYNSQQPQANAAPSATADNRNYAPVYQPVPQVPPNDDRSQDAGALFVPRLGTVRGIPNYKTIRNRVISAWLGLKYGVVGGGLARFQRASPYTHYGNAPIDATREPRNCPQFPDLAELRVDESGGVNVDDCLTLNIHAPAYRPGVFYPVLVFVHGEMLFDGSAAEGQPDYFMEHDVVLVSINYRLAPFGFVSTQTDKLPGNTALADIQMALEWVQQYIRAFGGNPEEVTLFGQAGGATLIHALTYSGKAEGLFHKLILQSGTALNPYFLDERSTDSARALKRYANCAGSEPVESCFERLSTTELLQMFQRYWEENEQHGLEALGGFKLVVGDYYGYLPAHPADLVANSSYPTIAGVAKDAGAFIMSRFYKELEQVRTRNISDYINVVLKHTTPSRYIPIWHNWALQHIFDDDDKRNPSLTQLAQGLLELTNLILYRAPVLDSVRSTSRYYPTYLYCFDYRGEYHRFGHLKSPLPFETDATLSDDNIYLFPYPEEVSRLNGDDATVARALTAMWVNFATYTQPNMNYGVWPNVTTEYGPFLRFTNSKITPLELDPHFTEGIPVPNLRALLYSTTTTTTTTPRYPYGNDYYVGTTARPTTVRPYGNDYYYGRPQPVQQPAYVAPRPPPTPYRPPQETVLSPNRYVPGPAPAPSNYEQRLAAHAAYNQRLLEQRMQQQRLLEQQQQEQQRSENAPPYNADRQW